MADTDPRRPLTYSEYIGDQEIVEALDLRREAPRGVRAEDWPVKPDGWAPGMDWPTGPGWAHDEVLFIRTHQAFEVWFAQIIHELQSVIRECEELWDGTVQFEDPRLAERTGSVRLLASEPDRWRGTRRVIEGAISRDAAAAEPLRGVWVPAQYGISTTFNPGAGETVYFHRQLTRWVERLDRASKVMVCTISFFDVLATMSPASFLAFRGRLQPASGFGSAQFREIEYLLGMREMNREKLAPESGEPAYTEEGSEPLAPMLKPSARTPSNVRGNMFYVAQTDWGRKRVAARARQHSLRDVVYGMLSAAFGAASGPVGPEQGLPDMSHDAIDRLLAGCIAGTLEDQYRNAAGETLDAAGVEHLKGALGGLNEALVHRETVAATLIGAHPARELFGAFLESCLGLDRALLQWRDRHIRFVEGMIGTRAGTGGGGVRYLRKTVEQTPAYRSQAFPCLWQARSFVQRDGR